MKNPSLLIFSTLFWLLPVFVFAHGNNYLEFNPDQSDSLRVASVNTPAQIFFAQNDFLGGIDLWVSNPGSSGTATFALLNDQGSVLTSRTVTIPTIANTSGGTRFHVDFNSQLSVLAGARYSVRITSSMPNLRLYYSDRVQLVAYNTPHVSEYVTGVGKLGSEEQIFSFKHALHETNETSAPIISNVGWTVISSYEMQVGFNANEAVDYRIEYGLSGQGYTQSTNFIGDYQLCISGVATCKLNISVLPATTYEYRLTTKDSWGNQSQVTGTFSSGQSQTPSPTPDPSILSISNLRIVEVTNSSVSIAWTTSKPANSFLVIRYSGNLSAGGVSDPVFELEHFLQIGQLSSSVDYRAEVTSHDMDNNGSEASISFQTLSGPTPTPTSSPTPSPTVSGPPPTSSPSPSVTPSSSPAPLVTATSSPSSGDTNIGTVQWSSPPKGEPSDGYRVDIFDKDGKLIKTIVVPTGSHSTDVPELADGEYNVIIYSNNGGVFQKVASPVRLRAGDEPFLKRLLALWPYLLIVAGLLVGLLIWRRIKNRPPQITTKVLPS